jgi:NAD(P)-dependent dehydrogenase (short-subunit alcohol dehydrogenase family)
VRVLIIGAQGTVGKAAAAALAHHEIIKAGRSSGDVTVDLTDTKSIAAMFEKVGKVDAIVACAGHTHFGPLATMTSEQFMKGINDKLMGQINLVLIGKDHVNDNGSITLTSGILDRDPIRQGVNGSAVNGALSGFVMAAAIEMPRGIRINVVSPGLLEAAAKKYEGFFPGHKPVSDEEVGLGYVKAVDSALTGKVITIG